MYEEEYEFWFDDELSRYDFTDEDEREDEYLYET